VRSRLFLWTFWRLLIGAGLLAGGRALDRLAGFRAYQAPGFAALAFLVGAALFFASARELAAAGPAGLAEGGPYCAVRHPLSVAFQLMLIGGALALGSPGGLIAAGPAALLLWAAHALLIEESDLSRRFHSQYRRYRRATAFLIPSIYFWSRPVTLLFYRLWCGVRFRGIEQVPRSGPAFLIALHRTYTDPFLMALGLPRRVHYIATSVLFLRWLSALYFKSMGCVPLVRNKADLRALVSSFKLLDSGGIIGMFPEGSRSWYGETACEPAVFRLLERRRVPIVTVELEGTFEHQPRYSRRLRRAPILVRYRAHPPGTAGSRQLIQDLLRRERAWDARRRRLGLPQPARYAEQLIYVCPQCAAPFRCRGYRDGSLVCGACGTRFTLLKGKGLAGPQGVWSLPELEKRNLAWSLSFRPAGLRIDGELFCRPAPGAGAGLQALRRLRREIGRCLRPGALVLEEDGLLVEDADHPSRRIAYGEIESILVESNCKLELSCGNGGAGLVFFMSPPRYSVFLQHFLRQRAFGNPYARYRGSNRAEVLPE